MKLADEGLELLDEHECLRLVDTVRVGRVAIARGAVPAVFPVTFARVGGDIMFFTGPGTKLDAAQEGRLVSFEVDEIDPLAEQGWSVLIVGKAELASEASRTRAQALGLYSWAAGERRALVRIRPEFVSGRRILLG
jgi:nitroimidazol reductase NimA-like FMN-containing flavoprotein (pyridoxamine 5'-phosphate oxidase superfamily)